MEQAHERHLTGANDLTCHFLTVTVTWMYMYFTKLSRCEMKLVKNTVVTPLIVLDFLLVVSTAVRAVRITRKCPSLRDLLVLVEGTEVEQFKSMNLWIANS